jgi:hypothetical protein
MSKDQKDLIEFEDAPRNAPWRMWSQDQFSLVLWRIESPASCVILPDASPSFGSRRNASWMSFWRTRRSAPDGASRIRRWKPMPL